MYTGGISVLLGMEKPNLSNIIIILIEMETQKTKALQN